MSVVSVTEKSRSTSIDILWRRTYRRVFTVEVSNPNVGPLVVRQAVDPVTALAVPQPGSYYITPSGPYQEHDYGAWVNNVSADMDGDLIISGGLQWTVTVEYGPFDSSLFGSDPTQWKM